MGNAYIGISDDYSATLWNPAGLGQLKRLEFSLGILNNSKENDITFLGNPDQTDISSTTLNNVSFVFPFPTVRGVWYLHSVITAIRISARYWVLKAITQ